GSDRPRAARIGARRHQAVVAPLPEALADWVNRREVDHVEAEVGDIAEMRRGVAKCSAPVGFMARRSGKHLVPRAKARTLAIHPDPQRQTHRRARAIGARVHQFAELVAERGLDALIHRRRLAQRVGLREQPGDVIFYGARGPTPRPRPRASSLGLGYARRRFANEERSLEQSDPEILTGGCFDLEIAPP